MSAWPRSEIVFLVALTLKVFTSIFSDLAAMLMRSHIVVLDNHWLGGFFRPTFPMRAALH